MGPESFDPAACRPASDAPAARLVSKAGRSIAPTQGDEARTIWSDLPRGRYGLAFGPPPAPYASGFLNGNVEQVADSLFVLKVGRGERAEVTLYLFPAGNGPADGNRGRRDRGDRQAGAGNASMPGMPGGMMPGMMPNSDDGMGPGAGNGMGPGMGNGRGHRADADARANGRARDAEPGSRAESGDRADSREGDRGRPSAAAAQPGAGGAAAAAAARDRNTLAVLVAACPQGMTAQAFAPERCRPVPVDANLTLTRDQGDLVASAREGRGATVWRGLPAGRYTLNVGALPPAVVDVSLQGSPCCTAPGNGFALTLNGSGAIVLYLFTDPGRVDAGTVPGMPAQYRPDGDRDRDGVPNRHERRHGTNPANPDSDADGWADGAEAASLDGGHRVLRPGPALPGAPDDAAPAATSGKGHHRSHAKTEDGRGMISLPSPESGVGCARASRDGGV